MYEYVEGGDLVNWLTRYEGRGTLAKDVLLVLRMAADALGWAHQRGIV